MSEVIATFRATDSWNERADPAAETTNCSLRDLSQKGFELAERHLDRVKVGRVLRQILHRCTSSLDCFLHASNLVGRKVVYHHDVTALERRCQALLEIGHERCSVDRPVEHHRCHHLIMPQGSYERDRLPCSLRNVADQSFTTWATAPEADHVDGDSRLIDEDQSRRIKIALLANPASTRSRHVGAVLLGCPQAFF
jgi:hypothetical protein